MFSVNRKIAIECGSMATYVPHQKEFKQSHVASVIPTSDILFESNGYGKQNILI